jgi:hypothetical protein
MIQDRDHQLCEQHFSSLIPRRARMGLHLSNTQAEICAVTLPHNRVAAACKSETSPMAAQRTLAKRQRQFIMQPVADSLSGRTVEQRQTFCMLSDKAHTCQKEQ